MSGLADLKEALTKHGGASNLSYGTAGFRTDAALLPGAMHRIGALAALRSRVLRGAAVGVMVTASHNMEPANGAKLVEPDGSMLDAAWEVAAGDFVNAKDGAAALEALGPLLPAGTGDATVVVARDTRSTSPALVALVKQGAWDANACTIDEGAATTPQLHFFVRARSLGIPHTLEAYYSNTRDAFIKLCGKKMPGMGGPVVVDCANGVGALSMDVLRGLIEDTVLVNDKTHSGAPLNNDCGADFVQKTKRMPTLHGAPKDGARVVAAGSRALWASLDGDADRLVMYAKRADDTVVLADGDRFATLLAREVSTALNETGLHNILTVGVAQTAYSNGAATKYLDTLPGVKTVDSCTGVKHLERAVHGFDVGIYWEPNGHGTVLCSKNFCRQVGDAIHVEKSVSDSLEVLDCVSKLANQAVGDGVADLLLVIGILVRRQMTFDGWLSIYKERCVANTKVRVNDKAVVQTEDFDRKVVSPVALKERINALNKCNIRAFVRPSGTEDVVRVFAEAETQEAADEAAAVIAQAVYDTCAGVGERV